MQHHAAPTAQIESAWYLVQCKSREDLRALTHLTRQGFTCFCPMFRSGSDTADKLERRPQPLFPGYLFIHLNDQDNWSVLRSTRGVSRVVGFAGQPYRVPGSIVEQLQRRCANAELAPNALNPGDPVQVRIGAEAEMNAIFLAMDGTQRVLLLLKLLNRELQICVPLSQLSG